VYADAGLSQNGTATANGATSTITATGDSTENSSLLTGRATAATGTPGPVTLGWTSTASGQFAWSALEITPAATCGTAQAPVVTTAAATGISPSGATLNGTVNPEGQSTTYQFEYGSTTAYGTVIPATPGSAGSGSTAVSESATLTGLAASTTYHYRLNATNATGTSNGADQQFTTSATGQAPAVTTGAASAVTSTGATLNGSVNPEGQAATYQFDYGTTTAYGTSVPSPAGSAGSGTTAVSESFALSGLAASTTYHYRIEAANATGTSLGADQQFTTAAAGTIQPTWAPGGRRSVALDEEFNGTSINTSLWQTGWFGTGITGPVNTSAQGCYSSSQATESGGMLHLNAIAQQNTCRGTVHPYTTGIVTSNPAALGAGKGFQFTQGAVEWRAFIPGSGSTCADWSSLWTDGQNWPATGEIDVLECLGGSIAWHLHSDAAGGASSGPGASPAGTWTGWHTFGADWTSTSVTFYYDGVNVGSHAYTVSAPNYLIMVLEIPSGSVTVPAEEDVDWVRVWN
jgi:hypothetical protein